MLNIFRIYQAYRDYRNRIPGDSRYTLSTDRRRWDRRAAFIMAAIVGLGATGLAALWWMASADARALEKGAVKTMAEVIDLEAEQSNGKTRYIVEVGFADAAGEAQEVRVVVSKEFFAGLNEGAAVPVTYAASDPTAVEVEPGTASAGAGLIGVIAAVMAVLTAVLALIGLLARPDQPALRRPPG